jgi:glutathione S-transferase
MLLAPRHRAPSQVYLWLLFAATELEQPLWRISLRTALYPQEMRLRLQIIQYR